MELYKGRLLEPTPAGHLQGADVVMKLLGLKEGVSRSLWQLFLLTWTGPKAVPQRYIYHGNALIQQTNASSML